MMERLETQIIFFSFILILYPSSQVIFTSAECSIYGKCTLVPHILKQLQFLLIDNIGREKEYYFRILECLVL